MHFLLVFKILLTLTQIDKFGDGFQLVVLELARKVCKANPNEKSRFVRIIYQLLQSEDPAVSYEAASTLCSLSAAPTAIRAAASCFCQASLFACPIHSSPQRIFHRSAECTFKSPFDPFF